MTLQGAQANVSGNLLEKTVQHIFSSKGFNVVKYLDWKKKPSDYGK